MHNDTSLGRAAATAGSARAGKLRSPTRRSECLTASSACWEPGTLTIGLEGELDIATAPAFERLLRDVERDRWPTVAVDLRHLSFIDSSGTRVLLGANDRIGRLGGRMVFRHPSRAVRRTLAAIGVDGILDLTDAGDADRPPSGRAPQPPSALSLVPDLEPTAGPTLMDITNAVVSACKAHTGKGADASQGAPALQRALRRPARLDDRRRKHTGGRWPQRPRRGVTPPPAPARRRRHTVKCRGGHRPQRDCDPQPHRLRPQHRDRHLHPSPSGIAATGTGSRVGRIRTILRPGSWSAWEPLSSPAPARAWAGPRPALALPMSRSRFARAKPGVSRAVDHARGRRPTRKPWSGRWIPAHRDSVIPASAAASSRSGSRPAAPRCPLYGQDVRGVQR